MKQKKVDLDKLLNKAVALQQTGRLKEAEKNCREILKNDPDNPPGNHLLGFIMYQLGNYDIAYNLISLAIAQSPKEPTFYVNLGLVLKKQEKLSEALNAFEQALSLDSKLASAHYNQGLILQMKRHFDQALKAYDQALKYKPSFAEAHNNRGILLQEKKCYAEALNAYDQALKHRPKYAEAYNNRGNTLKKQEKINEAATAYSKALLLKPDYAEAYVNLGLILLNRERLKEALEAFDRAIKFKANYAEAYNSRGIVLLKMKKMSEAIAIFDQAIAIDPQFAEAYNSKGIALLKLGKFAEALAVFDRAIAIKPDYVEAYNNRGHVFRKKGDLEAALKSFDQALALKSDYVEGYNGRGITLQDQGRVDEALTTFETALSLDPKHAKAVCNSSFLLLSQGDFAEGWKRYEWRWKDPDFCPKRKFKQPEWDGSELKGKKILVYSEQGMGDNMQFIRYIPLLKKKGAYVIVECPETLKHLFATITDIDNLITKEDKLPDFDLQIPLLSLPYILGTTLDNIPCQVPYIFPPKTGPEIETHPQLKNIGLVWAGEPRYENDLNRSIDIYLFKELFNLSEVNFFSLQYGKREDDINTLGDNFKIIDLSKKLSDFSVTAFLIDKMDLIISVDTAVAHLSGALGKPVWTLLPFASDWRWMLKRADSPWYPSMRLFRQPKVGDWKSVLKKVREELIKWIQDQ
ncbi:tetratricopeptide repeat protein [Candidatus Auribacterota bacterium]